MRASVRVPSLSQHGVSYEVVSRAGAAHVCECPRFVFSRKASQGCGHTEIVARADRLLARCAEAHGMAVQNTGPPGEADYRPVAALCRQCLVELLALAARKVRKGYVTRDAAKAKVAAARRKRTRKKKEEADGEA